MVLELILRYYSRSYNNLGIVEHQNNNLDKALEYYEKSLSLIINLEV
ncbi:MAG: tetratricopeptide repeat protein [Ignavibacteria bacterium]